MRILGIETSCDETGVAVYDSERGLLAHLLYSQVKVHAEYGGVVPELASRDHVRRILPLIRRVLAESGSGRGRGDSSLGDSSSGDNSIDGIEIGRASCRERG